MKKQILLLATIFMSFINVSGQVGIGTDNPKATLDVKAEYPTGISTEVEGILIPRLDRQRAQVMTGVETSTLIYVNNISTGAASGQAVNIDAVGFYYFDGSEWQKLGAGDPDINIYKDNGALTSNRTVNMLTNTMSFNSGATTGTSHFNVDGSTFNVDAVNNRVGVGTNAPNAKLDIRKNPTSTSDPQEGMLGIGTTNTTAPLAGAGAVRYSTSSGGILQYSNGVVWNTLTSTVQKSIVVAKKITPQNIINDTNVTGLINNVINWQEVFDSNNDFNPVTGIFTAPRAGVYIISFSFTCLGNNVKAISFIEAMLISSEGDASIKKSTSSFSAAGVATPGATISFAMLLKAGEKINPSIYNNTGYNQTLRVGTGSEDGFINFSVSEL